jgi:hypothetical protein
MPFWRHQDEAWRSVESQETFMLDKVDALQDQGHIARTRQQELPATVGVIRMGAIRKLSFELSAGRAPSPIKPKEADLGNLQPRRFLRVPTHAIGVVRDRRRTPRACLCLPMRLVKIGDALEAVPVTLVTKNISSTGIYFLAPRVIEPGTAIELEVALVERPSGCGSVRLRTAAHIVRTEASAVPGWNGFAASFDDIDFQRDDKMPSRDRSH